MGIGFGSDSTRIGMHGAAIPYVTGQGSTAAPGVAAQGVMPEAYRLYQEEMAGNMGQFYPGQMVADRTPMQGMADTMAYNTTRGMLNSGHNTAYSPWAGANMAFGFGTGQAPQANFQARTPGMNPGMAAMATSGGGVGGAPAGLDSALGRMMSGQPQNPYLDQMSSAAMRQTQQAVNDMQRGAGRTFSEDVMGGLRSDFGGAGQYGSSRHQLFANKAARDWGENMGRTMDRATQTIGDINTNLYGGAYNKAQDVALGAAGIGGGMANAATGANAAIQTAGMNNAARLGLGQMQYDLGAQNINADMARSNAMLQQGQNQLGLQAAGMMPGLQQAPFQLYDRMAGIGQGQQNYNQQLIDADMQRWNYNQLQPWNALGRYNQFIQPYSGVGTTSRGGNFQMSW